MSRHGWRLFGLPSHSRIALDVGGCSSPTGTEVVRCTLVPPEVEGEEVEGEGLGGREGEGGVRGREVDMEGSK